MKIQWGKMILHGLISAVFYIGLPLGIIYIFEYLNVITFADSFTISIIIFGLIGTFFSMLKYAFPKETSANRLVSFFISIYSGIFLFYIFGGFEPSTKLGTYYIQTDIIQILLGMQIIAWLLLGSIIIRALQYLVEAIELRNKKDYKVSKKGFKLSQIFKAFGFLMGLLIMGYFASIIYSGMNLNFHLHEMVPSDVGWDKAGTLSNYTDDSINITLTFDIINNGLYAIYDVNLSLGLYASNGTKLGGAPNQYFGEFHSFTQTLDQSVTLVVNSTYVGYLILNSDTLTLQISFETLYAAIYIYLTLNLPVAWSALV
jgi:hypothetical protein